MIIDVRMSDDISLIPAQMIPALFADQNRTLFFTQYRTGPAHSDLSNLTRYTVAPRVWAYTEPVIILTGEQVTGAAEAFVSAMEHIPHVTLIGDTTGGGGNIPGYFNQMYWPVWESSSVTCPFARVFTADTVSIEGIGILPDIYVQTTPADFLAGHDPVLEYAIEWIAEETAP
jgi:C-terminal processing protease CtpA/Prc